jgi:hypothetical protein
MQGFSQRTLCRSRARILSKIDIPQAHFFALPLFEIAGQQL